ncbi:MAG: S8 family serine peptidase [Planctomycetota bacterium]
MKLFVAAFLLASPGLSWAQSGPVKLGPTSSAALRRPTPQLVVGMALGEDVEALLDDFDAAAIETIAAKAMHLVELAPGTSYAQAQVIATSLASDPATVFAELNLDVSAPETPGCDAVPSSVGAQDCTVAFFDGQPTPEKYYDQPAVPLLGVEAAYAQLIGTPTVVAVIDTGIDPTHPMLASNLFSLGIDLVDPAGAALDLGDGIDSDHDGLVDEAVGHGTHVAGTIVLMHPDALVLPIRALDSDGNGTAFDVAQGIIEAVLAGADVINLSLGMSGPSAAVQAALELADEAGVDVLASAGNTGGQVLYPAAYPDAAAVTAVDGLDVKASFAAYGLSVTFAAPGVEIYSTMPGGAYAWWSGTSMATAVASGAVSLIRALEQDSSLEPDAVDAVEESSAPLDELNPGFEGLLGEGRIDLAAASSSLGEVGED